MNKTLSVAAAVLALSTGYAAAQSAGAAIKGDPAASSTAPNRDPQSTTGVSSGSKSGSGTSTSGGKDDTGDQGRDKMPDTNMNVRPQNQQPEKPH